MLGKTPTYEADFCIIGSGVAGAVVAKELVSRGFQVLMIEAGDRETLRDERRWVDLVMRGHGQEGQWPPFPAQHLITHYASAEYENTGDVWMYIGGMRTRGGSTLHWEGYSPRLQPEDFYLKSNTGHGADWPVTYSDLEPYYALAERTIGVAGDSTDAGHPPRSSPFPLSAFPYVDLDQPFLRAMANEGYSVQHFPITRNTDPSDDRQKCRLLNTCMYCPLGARFSGDQILDELEGMKNFRCLLRKSAIKLVCTKKERISGLEIFDQKTAQTEYVTAKKFIVCGGAIQSPKLLLASKNQWWAHGIGNDYGMVGRGLFNHVNFVWGAFYPKSPTMNGDLAFITAASRHFDSPQYQAIGKFIVANQPQRDPIDAMIMAGHAQDTIDKMRRGPKLHLLSATFEQFPSNENFVSLASGTDRTELPRTRIHYGINNSLGALVEEKHFSIIENVFSGMGCASIYSISKNSPLAHPMGTCRMGSVPENDICDRELRVFGTENLFVCSSAVFPSGGAANPTLTIVALAHRLGNYLANTENTSTLC